MTLRIRTFVDGLNDGATVARLHTALLATWNEHYSAGPSIEFLPSLNVKRRENLRHMPAKLTAIAEVRNPDIYFYEETRELELGGVEITTHSPDGSNIEKRYPFIWAARREGVAAFIATPYAKKRPGGQINRIPHRHAQRNLAFGKSWAVEKAAHIQQILPTIELTEADIELPKSIREKLWNWDKIGSYFAHSLAHSLGGEFLECALSELTALREELCALASACADNTNDTDPSSLIQVGNRWIQVYNSRPDSGHWERGEGQFDSIDGRLMFTHDGIELLSVDERPDGLEFWLPQMVSEHAWIREQVDRSYGSKRLKNLVVTLQPYVTTKFADHLSAADWQILEENPRLLLERLDWPAGLYHIPELIGDRPIDQIARLGLSTVSQAEIERIRAILEANDLWLSTHRAYASGWKAELESQLAATPTDAAVLVPRIPGHLLSDISSGHVLIPAESCTKDQLRALRQLTRSTPIPERAN